MEKIKWYEYISLILGIIGLITIIVVMIIPMFIIATNIYGIFIPIITVFIPIALFIILAIILSK